VVINAYGFCVIHKKNSTKCWLENLTGRDHWGSKDSQENIKMDPYLEKDGCICRLDSHGLVQRLLVVSCKHSNESLDSMIGELLVDQLVTIKDFATWCELLHQCSYACQHKQ
jgi:hypothetical protein